MEKKRKVKAALIIFITVILTAVAVLFAVNTYLSNLPIPIDNVIRISRLIDSEYMGEYNADAIEKEMLKAAVKGLGDKYSVYYDELDAKEQMLEIEGFYVGIGIEAFANSENNKIEVISAYDDTPAHKAGIRSGDFIIKVNGKDYSAESFPEAIAMIKGLNEQKPLEKELTLTIERGDEVLEKTLKREKIKKNTVKSEIIDGMCYIRYPGFDPQSVEDVKDIIEGLDKNVSGIIFDIRNNPGGEFGSAIDLCDVFLDDATVMYTVDKSGDKEVYKAKKGKCELPLAVLVNNASASASEIFAGSLQSNGRATIVGEKTYGKGVSQSVSYLNIYDKSSGAVKLTTCRNYLPDGKWLNESVTPDIKTDTEITIDIKEDSAIKAAIEYIKGKE